MLLLATYSSLNTISFVLILVALSSTSPAVLFVKDRDIRKHTLSLSTSPSVAPRRRLTSADAPTIIQQGTGNQGTPATSTTNQIASRRRSPSGCSTAPVAPRRRLTPTSKMIRPRGRSVDGSQKGSL
ncbi:hypothetical protein L5515_016451 [Caenorhabditis briggsae]|uniref:Uncharacterized protein n=1 Tax=Caenorhabditis briggsae TaxID=6238 RepID=A0AAE9FCV2_CAEBR|nr:hypothetical protein L5515_016451 [Caenorhabditis briggsae]